MSKISSFVKNAFHHSVAAAHDAQDHLFTSSARKRERSDHLFVDTVHHELDNERPYGNSRSAVKKLKNLIHNKLGARGRISSHAHATAFAAISNDRTGLFTLTAANGQALQRTSQEMALHVLLQSQFRHSNAVGIDTGDTVTLERTEAAFAGYRPVKYSPTEYRPARNPTTSTVTSPTVSPAPVNSPVPSATIAQPATATNFRPAEVMDNASGSKTRIFFSQTLDMQQTADLFAESHASKSVSSLNNNCWWRASFATSIMQHDTEPGRLQAALEALQLGPDYADDIHNVLIMTAGNAEKGMTEIFTEMTHAELSHDLQQPSRLKMPGEQTQYDINGNSQESIAETSCKRLAKAILLKKGHDVNEVEECVNGTAPADAYLVTSLVEALDANLIIFNQPWARNTMPPRISAEESTLTICARPGSRLDQLEHDANKEECTAAVLREAVDFPILKIRATHYDMHVPNTNIAQCNYPVF